LVTKEGALEWNFFKALDTTYTVNTY
jgi:hypothetical protein